MGYFDLQTLARNRARAFAVSEILGKRHESSFLVNHVLEMMLERLEGHFGRIMDLGCHSGNCAQLLDKYITYDHLIQCDLASEILNTLNGDRVVIDEHTLPFKESCFSLVISAMTLHAFNDLNSIIKQIFKLLNPGGIFIANLFGHETLKELRSSIIQAESLESARRRIFPFITIKDAGRLLHSSGFKFAVADSELIQVQYSDIRDLFLDLKNMGESNALKERNFGLMTNKMLEKIVSCYPGNFASFEIIVIMGVKPL